jgi:hypothetical protein
MRWHIFRHSVLALLLGLAVTSVTAADGFTFSGDAEKEAAENAARSARIEALKATPCGQRVKEQRIVVIIGERTKDGWETTQERFDEHFRAINSRLQRLGLRTYTPEQIRAEVAQAQIDAYFRNDPDAALAASRRLGADYVLRGDIDTRTGYNRVIGVNEVAVTMSFSLSSAGGRLYSQVDARQESYAGRDTLGMALILINDQADELVAQLYSDYCRKASR